MEVILKKCEDVLAKNQPSDQLIIDLWEKETELDAPVTLKIPFEPLATHYAVSIYRKQGWTLAQCLLKLQKYAGFDMRYAAAIDFITAQRLLLECDTDDLKSVVKTICQLNEDQLNILGY